MHVVTVVNPGSFGCKYVICLFVDYWPLSALLMPSGGAGGKDYYLLRNE